MATHLSGRFSPPPRRKSPSNSNSHAYHSHNKFPSQPPRDRYRDRSLPPRRYPQYENELVDHEVANRQSIPPPSHRVNLKPTSPFVGNSNLIDHREQRASSETMKSLRPTNFNIINSNSESEDSKKKREDIFKNILEVITDISSLKVENKKATVLFETSKEKYERTTCHHSRFPNLKTTLQNELDKAKESVEKINEELSRRDGTLRELAEKSLPILLPAIQASENEKYQKSQNPKILERLESVISKSEQQYADLQQEFGRFKEEQRKYQTVKDKQLASQEMQLKEIKSAQKEKEKLLASQEIQLKQIRSTQMEKEKQLASQEIQLKQIRSIQMDKEKQLVSQEIQLKEIKSTQLEKDIEIAKLRSQLRTLNDDVSILRKEKIDTLGQIELVRDKFNSTHRETIRISAHLAETEGKYLEKLKSLEAQILSLTSVKSGFKVLRENGLLDLKASTVEDISSTLKVAVGRIDSLPSAASYFSLNSRLETLEKEMISEPHKKEIHELLGLQIQSRLNSVENAVAKNQSIPESSYMSISAVEEKIDSLSKQVLANSNSSKVDEELQNLRSVTVELLSSLNKARLDVSRLQQQTQSSAMQSYDDSRIERVIEAKTRKMFAETFRKLNEFSQMIGSTNHSVENLMARVDNVTTGHLAQVILNQLSETYPHIQSVEQLYINQGKQLRDLQNKIDNLGDIKANQISPNQSTSLSGSNCRNLGNEVDKISEDIFKVNQNIKKLAMALEEERKSVSEKLTSNLNGLVSSDDLDLYKTQLDSHIQSLVENGIEEHTKNKVLPKLDKASKSVDIETFNKFKDEIESSVNLVKKNISKISDIEEKISSLKVEIVSRITDEVQEQNGGLSELIASQVDRSFASKQSDFVKEVTKYLESKESSSPGSTRNPLPSTNTAGQKALSPSTSLRSKRKLHDIKSENFHRTSSPKGSNRYMGSKKTRYNSSGSNDTP
ncbi:hypothetical protein EPUL_003463 [Erysiphe pulchra]|uniref:Blumeria specific protein n=1 Tax=Erysiphe pulchra TaxID=225359 RepID=A0A2S4PRC9_9PEZI|nr:hypothetical protein EPUL_003463 [Erysiphe pulchra]